MSAGLFPASQPLICVCVEGGGCAGTFACVCVCMHVCLFFCPAPAARAEMLISCRWGLEFCEGTWGIVRGSARVAQGVLEASIMGKRLRDGVMYLQYVMKTLSGAFPCSPLWGQNPLEGMSQVRTLSGELRHFISSFSVKTIVLPKLSDCRMHRHNTANSAWAIL
jgi:hypothetical protein